MTNYFFISSILILWKNRDKLCSIVFENVCFGITEVFPLSKETEKQHVVTDQDGAWKALWHMQLHATVSVCLVLFLICLFFTVSWEPDPCDGCAPPVSTNGTSVQGDAQQID